MSFIDDIRGKSVGIVGHPGEHKITSVFAAGGENYVTVVPVDQEAINGALDRYPDFRPGTPILGSYTQPSSRIQRWSVADFRREVAESRRQRREHGHRT